MTGVPGLATVGRETMRALLAQPGRLTAEFVAGTRRIGPVRLFVITAVLFAAVRFGASFGEPVELSTSEMVGFRYLVVYTAMMTAAAAATLYLAERAQ